MKRLAIAALLGLMLAATLAACGADSPQESGAEVTQPPLDAQTATATVPTTTVPTTTATTTTTPPSTATTTTPATTPTTTTPATTPTTSTQDSGGAPAGCGTAVGGFIRDVQASGADCGAARTVAAAWFDAVHEGAAPDSTISAAGYTCGGTLAGQRASVSCTSGAGRVDFTASP